VEYRSEKYFSSTFLWNNTHDSVRIKILFAINIDSAPPPFHILLNY
jgi:hypothetical protein